MCHEDGKIYGSGPAERKGSGQDRPNEKWADIFLYSGKDSAV